MPELPEVETIVRGLKKSILGRKIEDVWSDAEKIIKRPKGFSKFKKEIKGKKVLGVGRRAKNILIDLSGNKVLLVHQKMTGHLLFGKWRKTGNGWKAAAPGPLGEDPMNRFLHLVFWLDNGKQLALSDLRKFAKVELWDRKELAEAKEIKTLGPEPLLKNFSLAKLKEALKGKKGKIKKVLMDQRVIAGIGNIYSDEILFFARVHPEKEVGELSEKDLRGIHQGLKKILPLAIKLQGDSVSDFRTLTGERGGYNEVSKVYRKEGEECPRCRILIKRVRVNGRSAHFCPKCQKK